MNKYFWSILVLIFSFSKAEEISSNEIIKQIQTGTEPIRPTRFGVIIKPINLLLSGDGLFPIKIAEIKQRIYGDFGIQVDPVLVISGNGGYGFAVGPTLFSELPFDGYHMTIKYEFDYINKWGIEHGLFAESTKFLAVNNLLLAWGASLGWGVAHSQLDGRGLKYESGLTGEFTVGIGFAI